jgi:hypothetical protein
LRRNKGLQKKQSTSAKKQTQKEHMKELRGTLPEGSEPLKTIVHKHTRLLLGVEGTDLKTLPLQPNVDEQDLAVQREKKPWIQSTPSNRTSQFKQSYPCLQELASNSVTRSWSDTIHVRLGKFLETPIQPAYGPNLLSNAPHGPSLW